MLGLRCLVRRRSLLRDADPALRFGFSFISTRYVRSNLLGNRGRYASHWIMMIIEREFTAYRRSGGNIDKLSSWRWRYGDINAWGWRP